jgi:hypothetical protein
MAIIALVSPACGIDLGGAGAPGGTQPAQAAATEPEGTEAATQGAAVAPTAGAFFTDEFELSLEPWTYFVSTNPGGVDDGKTAPYLEDGFFVFDLGKNLNMYATYYRYSYKDVRMDVRVENRGNNNNSVNLVCRYSDAGWYEAAIASNGLYRIYAVDTAYHALAEGGSNKIKQGKDVNELTLICNDTDITLLVNGTETRTVRDTKYGLREGQIGVGLSSLGSVPIRADFDWVKVSEP